MGTPRAVAVLIGLICVVPLAEAQLPKAPESKAPEPKAQEFRLEEVASLADLPIRQLKPKTIAFADRPAENLVDPGTGFMRYEDWPKSRRAEQPFLRLRPRYTEPHTDISVHG